MGWMMECASMRRERAMVFTDGARRGDLVVGQEQVDSSSTGEPESSATLVSLST